MLLSPQPCRLSLSVYFSYCPFSQAIIFWANGPVYFKLEYCQHSYTFCDKFSDGETHVLLAGHWVKFNISCQMRGNDFDWLQKRQWLSRKLLVHFFLASFRVLHFNDLCIFETFAYLAWRIPSRPCFLFVSRFLMYHSFLWTLVSSGIPVLPCQSV